MMFLFLKREKYLLGAGLALILVILLVLIGTITKGENIAYFYPESCLGNWQNPEKAAGEKEIDDNYNELNSAFFDGGLKEIYCGNFKGEIPEGKINSVNLKIDWLWTDTKINYIPVESKEDAQINSFLQEIIPAKEVILVFDTTTSTEPTSTEQNSTTSEPIPSPNNQNIPPETRESPTSTFYLPKLFNLAFAQEQSNTSSTSTNITTLPEPTTSIEINTSSTTTTNNPEKIFQIFYTLNGTDWLYLTDVDKTNWQNFSINIPVNDWLDLEKVQIKIQSLPILGNYPYVYLKSMILEVNYQKEINDNNILSSDDIEKIHCKDISSQPTTDEEIKNIFLKFLLVESEDLKNYFFKTTSENWQEFNESAITVLYSSDESGWQILGEINKENWQNPIFKIPTSSFNQLFKIKIEPAYIFEERPILNSYKILLEIEYENCEDEKARWLRQKRAEIIELITKLNNDDDSWLKNPNAEILINKLIELVESNLVKTNLPLAFKGNKIFWVDDSFQSIYIWEIDKDNLFGFDFSEKFNFQEEGIRWQLSFDPVDRKFIFISE
jgi:hypothetical protein